MGAIPRRYCGGEAYQEIVGVADSQSKTPITGREAESAGLTGLLGRVSEDLATLMEAKLGLLKIEIEEDIRAYARGGVAIGAGSVIAVVGFALLNVGIGFFISALFENTRLTEPMKYALGFLIPGVTYLVLGGAIVMKHRKRLAERGIVPERSVAELQKDKQWLKKEL